MATEYGPLLILSRKLSRLGRPPSLSSLVAAVKGNEDFREFVRMVREFLPEREAEILFERTPAAQMALFASYFEDRYFPLHQYVRYGDAGEYSELTGSIPVVVMGIDYEDYHYLASDDSQPGYQLITYLLHAPFWEDG
jgi:hypothetical protein